MLWCDELYWKTGPRHKRKIKRRRGKQERNEVQNVQYDKPRKQEPEDVQRERKFHLFTVLGYDFAWCMPYETSHSNGKMTSKMFIENILPALQAELLHRGGEWTLYMDRDSAHTSKKTLNYMLGLYFRVLKVSRLVNYGDLGRTNKGKVLSAYVSLKKRRDGKVLQSVGWS